MQKFSLVGFDCDGVLLDSNRLKSSAFADCLSGYPSDIVVEFLKFQATAFGKSRYRLFDIFFSDYLSRDPFPGERERILFRFSSLCSEGYPKCEITAGAVDALEWLKAQKIPMYVASGSDEAELRLVLEEINLSKYFSGIFGSPTSKLDNLKKINDLAPAAGRHLFFGDAKADWEASQAAGFEFVYISGYSADPDGMHSLQKQHSFRQQDDLSFVVNNIFNSKFDLSD